MKQNYLHTEGGGATNVKTIKLNPDDVEFLVIDEFAGFGGTTKAFALSKAKSLVIAAINHDEKAITSHWLNHPEVEHYNEDITLMYGKVINGILFKSPEMMRLIRLVDIYRACYPNAKLILWASLECTNFSKAKGGQPRDADSRALADHMDRYVEALDPDYFKIENVVEFMSWGPLRIALKKKHKENLSFGIYANSELKTGISKKTGKEGYLWIPENKHSGKDYLRWCKHIRSFGYYDQWRQLNSADYGAYTSRNRLFGCFAKPGLPIVWPESTHAKEPISNGLFGSQEKWKAVKDVLDFDDEGKSIFNRKKPLVDASLERIEAGLIKFVAGGKEAFLLKYNSACQNGDKQHTVKSIEEPAPTIPCQNRNGICFISKYYSGDASGKVINIDGPAHTIRCKDAQSLVRTLFISKNYSGRPDGKVSSIDSPSGTVTTFGGGSLVNVKPFIMNTNFKNVGSSIESPAQTLTASRHHPYVVNPKFLASYYGNGYNIRSVDEPCATLPTKDRCSLINPVFIYRDCKTATNTSINEPIGSLTAVPKANIINCQPFILNPSHGWHCTGTEVPCVVIVARQDKAPLYLIQFHIDPNVSIPIYDDDSAVMIRIKKFMALYGLSDILMRMLKVSELLPIQGFPVDYKMVGNQTDHKKMIGNSVVPQVVKCWIEALGSALRRLRIAA
ncbi:DNA methyltransferase [Pedobacter sp. KBW01]|uniref:DNA cytosine methyltransferase n=1 Tax=Pedobacter sp. KBW01 TaxID=2153364 RepID=UPI000F5B1E48|nr:DNA cytosine methyltransferase [Pedobacter sp. KBW01]RQO79170.1 DNA methyltransferase [Pedobacter sp. KBW01]